MTQTLADLTNVDTSAADTAGEYYSLLKTGIPGNFALASLGGAAPAAGNNGLAVVSDGSGFSLTQVNGGVFGFYLENDFLYYNGTMAGVNQQVSGTSAAGGTGTGTANHPGMAALTTGTDTTGRAGLQGGAASILLGGGELTFRSIIRTPSALSDGTDTYTIYSGLNDSATGDGTDGVFFRYTHSANSGKWQCVTRSNSTETAGDGGITVGASTFYNLRFVVNAAASSVSFYINDVLKLTQTTNIPSGTGRETALLPANIVKSAGTNARQMDIDYFKIFQYFTTAR